MDGPSSPPLTCGQKPGGLQCAVRRALNKISPALGLGLGEPQQKEKRAQQRQGTRGVGWGCGSVCTGVGWGEGLFN